MKKQKTITEAPVIDKNKLSKAILAFGGNVRDDTLKNLSAYTLNNLSADTLNNLSADTLKKIKGIWEDVPLVKDIYTTLLNDINEKKRVHNQSNNPISSK